MGTKLPNINMVMLIISCRYLVELGLRQLGLPVSDNKRGFDRTFLGGFDRGLLGAIADHLPEPDGPKLSWQHRTVQLGSDCDGADTTMTHGAGFWSKHLNNPTRSQNTSPKLNSKK